MLITFVDLGVFFRLDVDRTRYRFGCPGDAITVRGAPTADAARACERHREELIRMGFSQLKRRTESMHAEFTDNDRAIFATEL